MNEESKLLGAVNGAREAFESDDKNASRQFHDTKKKEADSSTEESHQTEGGLLKPVIFGGLDGILTSFAIVAGAAGGNLSPGVVLVLGFSNIFADALSMGVGEFLSSKANNEWILNERRREEWEMENYREGEIQEMIDIYMNRGNMTQEDATSVITTVAKYKDFFVDLMMVQELQLLVPESDHIKESFIEGIIMFCSFAFFGIMPLLGYVIIPFCFPHLGEESLFVTACIITGIVLFLMGCLKSRFCIQHWVICGTETLVLGGTCAFVAYTIGYFVNDLISSSDGFNDLHHPDIDIDSRF